MEKLSNARIQAMQKQGWSNNQIIQTLQREGYKSAEIFDALNQASIQTQGMGAQGVNQMQAQTNDAMGFANTQTSQSVQQTPFARQALNSNPPQMNTMPAMNTQGLGPQGMRGGSDEELIEAIIDEKWNDLLEDINKIITWKERTTQRIDQFEQQLKDLKDQFDKLHNAVIGKVGEYDQHILQVGAEVKAMEKVFSKVLPVFTENVGELSRIADQMKSENKKR